MDIVKKGCKICRADNAREIDKAIIEGDTLQSIADRTGFHISTISRHKAHIADKLRNVAALTDLQDGSMLMQRIGLLLQRAENLLDKAESKGDLRIAISAIREVRGTLELFGKASGELAPEKILIQVEPVINVLVAILQQEVHDSDTLARIAKRIETEAVNI